MSPYSTIRSSMSSNESNLSPQPLQTQETTLNAEPVSEQHGNTDPVFSVFSIPQRKIIVLIVSLGSLCSGMSTNIYVPALNQVAKDLNVSSTKINLTVTTFVILQGLAPMMVAGFSDGAGRRPAYILCFIIYLAANIGLALQRNYAALMVLRCVQSAGGSGTVVLAYGVVADLVTSSDRGMYIAYTSVTSILAPVAGPVIGGVLAQYGGWWWIFWFLAILSGVYLVSFALFLPETCRHVVGDGSIPPPPLNQSLTDIIRHKNRIKAGHVVDPAQLESVRKNYHLAFPNPLSTLIIATDKEAALILFCGGVTVALFYAMTTAIPSQFGRIYGFDELQLGLVYVPFGAGSLISAFTTGKLVDLNYRRHAARHGFPTTRNRYQDLTDFPIEQARLEIALPLLYLGVLGLIGYGWTLHYETNLAGPLILLFVFGYGTMAGFQVLQTLMIDMNPGNAAAATAANNLFRCLLSAGATAVVVPMIDRMGVGWAYTFASLLWFVLSPSLLAMPRYGPAWRKAKKDKKDQMLKIEADEKEARAADSNKTVMHEELTSEAGTGQGTTTADPEKVTGITQDSGQDQIREKAA